MCQTPLDKLLGGSCVEHAEPLMFTRFLVSQRFGTKKLACGGFILCHVPSFSLNWQSEDAGFTLTHCHRHNCTQLTLWTSVDTRFDLVGQTHQFQVFRVLVANASDCAEGISFLAVRHVHLTEVPLSQGRFLQICGRALRMFGHASLPKELPATWRYFH